MCCKKFVRWWWKKIMWTTLQRQHDDMFTHTTVATTKRWPCKTPTRRGWGYRCAHPGGAPGGCAHSEGCGRGCATHPSARALGTNFCTYPFLGVPPRFGVENLIFWRLNFTTLAWYFSAQKKKVVSLGVVSPLKTHFFHFLTILHKKCRFLKKRTFLHFFALFAKFALFCTFSTSVQICHFLRFLTRTGTRKKLQEHCTRISTHLMHTLSL